MGRKRIDQMRVPFSVQSVFHGVSLLLVFCCVLGAWVALWQISYHELYSGNNNSCFSGNTAATYGSDNMLYCPNTYLISKTNITILNTGVVAYLYNQPASSIAMNPGQNFTMYTGDLYIDDDDEEIAWWFVFNPGTQLQMTFTDVNATAELVAQIDDDDYFEIPGGNSTAPLFAPSTLKHGLPSRNYKFSFTTNNVDLETDETYGKVSFEYVSTVYGQEGPSVSISNTSCNVFERSCVWEYEFGEDACISIWNNNARDWGNDYSGACVQINQVGWDEGWTAFLVPLSVLVAITIIVINVAVMLISNKLHRKKQAASLDLYVN